MLQTSTKRLLAQWNGPFPGVEKVSPVDYKVRHDNGVTKVYHVNMLKRWFERNEEPDERVIAAVCIADHLEEDNEGIGNQLMEPRDTYRDVKIAETLSIEQRRELEEYLKEYSAVLTNVPGRTSVLKHSVITTSDIPVRQKPYQIPHALRYEVKKELMAMVEAGTVEPSVSPYASPVVIITKKKIKQLDSA